MIKGRIHSTESFGTLDGPGIRTVVFFQGCPLKCKYCHNIDMGNRLLGKEYTVEELFSEVIKYKEYWGKDGGVTISGGEPTYQSEFLLAFLKKLKENNIHTAIDTCFGTSGKIVEKLIPFVDYWMVSVKHMVSIKHYELTGVYNEQINSNIFNLSELLAGRNVLRIRFLVIPGITNDLDHLKQLADFFKRLNALDIVEVLGYGTHGKFKWLELYGKYPLEGVPEATVEDIAKVKDFFKYNGIKVK